MPRASVPRALSRAPYRRGGSLGCRGEARLRALAWWAARGGSAAREGAAGLRGSIGGPSSPANGPGGPGGRRQGLEALLQAAPLRSCCSWEAHRVLRSNLRSCSLTLREGVGRSEVTTETCTRHKAATAASSRAPAPARCPADGPAQKLGSAAPGLRRGREGPPAAHLQLSCCSRCLGCGVCDLRELLADCRLGTKAMLNWALTGSARQPSGRVHSMPTAWQSMGSQNNSPAASGQQLIPTPPTSF